jgi:hypothetical protein
MFLQIIQTSSSSSLHGLGESPVPASSIVVVYVHLLLGLSMSRYPDGWYACSGMRVCLRDARNVARVNFVLLASPKMTGGPTIQT